MKKIDKYEARIPKHFMTPYGIARPHISFDGTCNEEEYRAYGKHRCAVMELGLWAERFYKRTSAKFIITEVSPYLIPHEVTVGDIVSFRPHEVTAVYDRA